MVGDVEAHNLLGRFLFPYDSQYKLIKDLSGGERARLALLKLTLLRCNFLILDEPTNHLDVEMIEALEDALADFSGTLLVISHDRRFIEATTDFIWELKNSNLRMYPGDWNYYQGKKAAISNEQLAMGSQSTANSPQARGSQKEASKTPSKWKLQQQLDSLEKEIQELEAKLSDVTKQLSDASHLSPMRISELGQEHHHLEETLLTQMTLWEEITKGLKP